MINPRTERKPDLAHDLRPHVEGRVGILPRFKRQFRPGVGGELLDVHVRLLKRTRAGIQEYILLHSGPRKPRPGGEISVSRRIWLICRLARKRIALLEKASY